MGVCLRQLRGLSKGCLPRHIPWLLIFQPKKENAISHEENRIGGVPNTYPFWQEGRPVQGKALVKESSLGGPTRTLPIPEKEKQESSFKETFVNMSVSQHCFGKEIHQPEESLCVRQNKRGNVHARPRHPETRLDNQEFLKGPCLGGLLASKGNCRLDLIDPPLRYANAIEFHHPSGHLPQSLGTTIARNSRCLPGIRGCPFQRGFFVQEKLFGPQELLRRPCQTGFVGFQRWPQLGRSLAG